MHWHLYVLEKNLIIYLADDFQSFGYVDKYTTIFIPYIPIVIKLENIVGWIQERFILAPDSRTPYLDDGFKNAHLGAGFKNALSQRRIRERPISNEISH